MATPLPIHCKLTMDQGPLIDDPTYYRAMIGKLNFLSQTRPNLSFVVHTLSQFMLHPRAPHLQALHHTLGYIQGTLGRGILLKASSQLSLQASQTLIGLLAPLLGGL